MAAMATCHESGSGQGPQGWRYEIDGQSFPMRVESRCRTCCHPRRVDIDVLLLEGVPPSVVAERLGPDAPTQSSIIRHRDRHLPTDRVARAALVRERAGGAAVSLDSVVDELVDSRSLARVLGAQGMKAIAEGRIMPLTFADVVRAADLLARTEALAGDPAENDAFAHRLAFHRLLRAVEETAPREVWDAIGVKMHTDPVIAAITRFETGRETEESKALLDREIAALGPLPVR